MTAAKVPSSVTIKAGETSATFTVTTILSKAAIGGNDTVVSIYANYGMTKHAELTVLAPVSFDRMIDKVIAREHSFIDNVSTAHWPRLTFKTCKKTKSITSNPFQIHTSWGGWI